MTDWTHIFIWVVVAVIIIFIVLGIINYFIRNYGSSLDPSMYQEEYSPFAFWGVTTVDTDTTRNSCKLYNFPAFNDASLGIVGGVPYAIPAQPSINPVTVDTLSPESAPSCYDIDQLVILKAQHTCLKLENLEDGDFTGENAQGEKGISFCTTYDGSRAEVGSTEIYYSKTANIENTAGSFTSVKCDQVLCTGTLSLIGVDYSTKDISLNIAKAPVQSTAETTGMKCLQTDGAGTITLEKCDITNPGQLFRLYRKDYGKSEPPATSGIRGLYGNTMQIYSRLDKTCVVADPTKSSGIGLGACTESWGLFNRQKGRVNSAVQQIVDINSLTEEQKKALFSEKDSDTLYDLMIADGVKSMKNTNGTLKMEPYQFYKTSQYSNADDQVAGQLIDYTLYNTVLFNTSYINLNQ